MVRFVLLKVVAPEPFKQSFQTLRAKDVGGHGWWRCVDLGDDLLSAIEAAKVSLEGGSDEA